MSAVPVRWQTLGDILRARPGHSVSLWFNPQLGGGYTAQVVDGKGGFAPAIDEGAIWSAYAQTPVDALDELARVIHRAVTR